VSETSPISPIVNSQVDNSPPSTVNSPDVIIPAPVETPLEELKSPPKTVKKKGGVDKKALQIPDLHESLKEIKQAMSFIQDEEIRGFECLALEGTATGNDSELDLEIQMSEKELNEFLRDPSKKNDLNPETQDNDYNGHYYSIEKVTPPALTWIEFFGEKTHLINSLRIQSLGAIFVALISLFFTFVSYLFGYPTHYLMTFLALFISATVN